MTRVGFMKTTRKKKKYHIVEKQQGFHKKVHVVEKRGIREQPQKKQLKLGEMNEEASFKRRLEYWGGSVRRFKEK